MNFEVKIISDVATEDEPILKVLSAQRAIEKYIKYDDTNTEETALITKMAIAAREVCEKYLNLSLAEKTIQVHFNREYVKRRNLRVELPYGPIGTVSEVLAVADDGTETPLTLNDGYYLIGNQFKDMQVFKITGTFGTYTSYCDYRVKYMCGYGISESTENLPSAIEVAMMKLFYGWYHNRDNWIPALNSEAEMILYPFRRRAWF